MSTSGPHRSVCAPDTSKAKHLLGSSELICELRKINPLKMALCARGDNTFTLRLLCPTLQFYHFYLLWIECVK